MIWESEGKLIQGRRAEFNAKDQRNFFFLSLSLGAAMSSNTKNDAHRAHKTKCRRFGFSLLKASLDA